MPRRLKKVTLKVEILMEVDDSCDGRSLHQIEHECLEGDWSYRFSEEGEEIIEGDEAVEKACNEQATDVSFFFPEYSTIRQS